MEKPLTLKIQEAEEKIVGILNESQLPAFVIKTILEKLYAQVEQIDKKEIDNYNESLKEKEGEK